MNGLDFEQLQEALTECNFEDGSNLEVLMNRGEWEAVGLLIRDIVEAYREAEETEEDSLFGNELSRSEEEAEWNRDADKQGIH